MLLTSDTPERVTLQRYNNALTNCTSYFLRKSQDEEGETVYLLIDGFGDQEGDPFYDLIDVRDYITNNKEVANYLEHHNF